LALDSGQLVPCLDASTFARAFAYYAAGHQMAIDFVPNDPVIGNLKGVFLREIEACKYDCRRRQQDEEDDREPGLKFALHDRVGNPLGFRRGSHCVPLG
jgi:hypothetical protein